MSGVRSPGRLSDWRHSLDFRGPRLADDVLNLGGKRDVLQADSGRIAVLVGPIVELDDICAACLVSGILWQLDEGGGNDWPALRARLIDQIHREILRVSPIAVGRGGLEGGHGWLDEAAGLILQLDRRELVLRGIG